MQDPAACTHAGSCHDQAGTLYFIQSTRIISSRTKMCCFQLLAQLSRLMHGQCLIIKQLGVLAIKLRGFNGHRAVDVNWERGKSAPLKCAGQEIQKQLSSTHGKNRDEDFGVRFNGLLDDLAGLDSGLLEGPMIPVAIG